MPRPELGRRSGTRSVSPARTAELAGAPLATLARETGAVYVVRGRLAPPRAPGQAALVELRAIAAADGALVGAESFDLGSEPEAGADLAQQAMAFLRGRIPIRSSRWPDWVPSTPRSGRFASC